jgi:hypothetical protein
MTADPYVPWRHPSPLLDAIGGFEQHATDPTLVAFDVDATQVNARGFLTPASSPRWPTWRSATSSRP